MINRPTVFILGAGASVPFGFPTGAKLREMICGLHLTEFAAQREIFLGAFPRGEATYRSFTTAFMHSSLASIDSFLGRRTEFQDIGKECIAACIASFEHLGALNAVNGRFGFSDWYGELWNRMMDGVNTLEELKENQLSFVTFNYDRSLEAFLHNSIQHTFGVSDEDAEAAWSSFPIHHVYGSLGEFRPSKRMNFGLPERGDVREDFLIKASKSIRVVPTTRGAPKDRAAMDILSNADTVGVLGFGFDETNCQRLSLAEALNRKPREPHRLVLVHATTLGLTTSEITRGTQRLMGFGPQQAQFRPSDGDCLASLRSWLPTLG